MLKGLKSLIVLTFLLILWGSVVRGTGSGLGCPDWPLCHGQWIPPFEKAVLIEYFHRLLASVVGFWTLGTCIAIWKNSEWRRQLGKWAGLLLILLLVQVILGAITVRTELTPHIVTTHLGIGLLFLGLIFYMKLLIEKGGTKQGIPRSAKYHLAHTTLFLLFLQILLGGLVASSQAGLACPDFPTCQGVWWPGLHGLVGLHFMHRLGAMVVSGMVLSVVFLGRGQSCTRCLLWFLLIQLSLGIGSIQMGLPLPMRVAHLGVAVLLYLGLIRSTYELRRQPSSLYSTH